MRKKLVAIYGTGDETSKPTPQKEATKAAAYAEFRTAYAQLKASWGGYDRYDAWVANANNAAFAALAAYDDWVAAFETLFAREHGDWGAFYRAVKVLAQLPEEERTRQLQQLQTIRQSDR